MNRQLVLAGTATIIFAALWLVLSSATAPTPSTTPDGESQRAVRTLVQAPPRTAAAAVPESFATTLGYTPRLEEGALVNPRGSCSSPVPLPEDFETACRQHDLGYDLLRHADRVGGTLPPTDRRDLDARFARDLRAACDTRESGWARAGCDGWAEIASGAVRLNSWRQHDLVPDPEDPGSIATGTVGVLAIGSGGGAITLGARSVLRRMGALLPRPRVSGAGAGAVGLLLSISPANLPHGPLLQGALTAVLVGLCLGVVALLRPRVALVDGAPRRALLGLAAIVVMGTLGWGHVALSARRTEAGLDALGPGYWLGVAAVVGGLALVVRTLGRAWAHRRRLWRPVVAVLTSSIVLASTGVAQASDTTPDDALLLEDSPVGAVRAYAEVSDGEGARERAEHAVDELEREGGLARSRIVVAVPTGTGWVNPELVRGLEARFGSDVATVAVQYDTMPSWYAYLFERDRSEEGARAIIDAVLDRVGRLPAGQRPDVHVQGESLGASAAQAVLSRPGAEDVRRQLCSTLWVGPPGGHRVGMDREVSVTNPDDPVVHASVRDVVLPPGDGRPWLPVVSGVHSAADFLGSIETPVGVGHVYGPDVVAGLRTCR
ncbi:MAG TPA: alpha/beta-hydrolase family protein [Candidatus Janibacter merdipullorum]|nr:alpha/beta-hydrolase family protein [Candidatus Janibacter merdipullorum]